MSKPKLYIMVGNIVSGKSTWIKARLQAYEDTNSRELAPVVISKDDLRRMIGAGGYVYNEKLEPIIHSCFIDILGNFMSKGISIIYDETNMDRQTRASSLAMAHGYEYETIAVVMPNPSKEKVDKRIALREGQRGWATTPKEIWTEVWKRKQACYEEPTKKEGFNSIWKIN